MCTISFLSGTRIMLLDLFFKKSFKKISPTLSHSALRCHHTCYFSWMNECLSQCVCIVIKHKRWDFFLFFIFVSLKQEWDIQIACVCRGDYEKCVIQHNSLLSYRKKHSLEMCECVSECRKLCLPLRKVPRGSCSNLNIIGSNSRIWIGQNIIHTVMLLSPVCRL